MICYASVADLIKFWLTPSLASHRNNLAQLKDAYTKLFEDYNELKEEKKKREVTVVL